MPLTKLQFRPGINREITAYSNEGGWVDCDKVRFRFGYPEKLGGWEKYSSNTYVGSARALHNWIALDGSNYLGVGTHLKYYIEEGQTFSDITPIRATTAAGDVTFSATDGSTTLTVSDTAHGCQEFDFVTFSGAVSLGGVVTADVLNQEYQVTRIVDADSYEVELAVSLAHIKSMLVLILLWEALVGALAHGAETGGAKPLQTVLLRPMKFVSGHTTTSAKI